MRSLSLKFLDVGAHKMGKDYFWGKAAAVFVLVWVICSGILPSHAELITKEAVFRTFKIPPEIGTIEELHQGTSNKTVIYIQDAHDSLEAQENIAKLIRRLVADHGVKTVFEEGYEGRVPTDRYFGFIKDPKIREKVSRFLMDHLRLGGAEYAHINRCQPGGSFKQSVKHCGGDFNLIGADSIELRKENIGQYRLSAAKQDVIAKDLKALEKELKTLANRHLPKEFQEWLAVKEQHDANKLDLLTYLERTTFLLKRRAGETEKKSNFIDFILEPAPSNDPAVVEKMKQINAREVLDELTRLEQAIAETYLDNETGRRIYEYYKTFELLRRLNDLQMSQEEYESVKTSLKAFDTESFARFVFGQTPKTIILSKMWERNLKEAIRFYEVAEARDSAISDTFSEYFSDGRSDATTQEIAILVYGGFHKENIKRLLEAREMSYLVVSPRITKSSPRHEAFYKQLMTDGRLSYELPADLRMATRAESRIEVWDANPALARTELGIIAETVRAMPGADPRTLGLAVERALKKVADQTSARAEMRTQPPPDAWQSVNQTDLRLLAQIQNEFKLSATNIERIPGGGGIRSEPILTFQSGNETFFVKRLKVRSREDAEFIMDYTAFLKSRGLPVLMVPKSEEFPSSAKDYLVIVDGPDFTEPKYYYLEKKASGNKVTRAGASKQTLTAVGQLLAKAHRESEHYQYPRPRNSWWHPFDRIIDRVNEPDPQWRRILEPYLDPIEERIVQWALRESVSYWTAERTQQLKKQMILKDANFSNLHFDESGNVAALFDFDSVTEGYRIEDFVAPLTDTRFSNIPFDFGSLRQDLKWLLEGYRNAGGKLEAFEIEAIPMMCVTRKLFTVMFRAALFQGEPAHDAKLISGIHDAVQELGKMQEGFGFSQADEKTLFQSKPAASDAAHSRPKLETSAWRNFDSAVDMKQKLSDEFSDQIRNPRFLKWLGKLEALETAERAFRAMAETLRQDAETTLKGLGLRTLPKIGVVEFYAFPQMGGVTLTVEAQARWLSSFLPVKVISGTAYSEFLPRHEKLSYAYIPGLGMEARGFQNSGATMAPEEFKVKEIYFYEVFEKELRDRDVVIIHNMMTGRRNLPATAALHRFIREHREKHFIIYTHDTEKDYHPEESPYRLLNLDYSGHEKNVFHVANSWYTRDEKIIGMYKIAADRISVVTPPIHYYSPLRLTDSARKIIKENRLLDQDLVLMFPTRINWNKDIPKAVEIVAALNRKGKKAKLLLVSDGISDYEELIQEVARRMRNELENYRTKEGLFRDFVVFVSGYGESDFFKHRQQVSDLTAFSDYVLVVSKRETFGMPAVEAVSVGTGAVVSRLPCHEETLMGHPEIAHLFDNGTPADQVADDILELEQKRAGLHGSQAPVAKAFSFLDQYELNVTMARRFLPLILQLHGNAPRSELRTQKLSDYAYNSALGRNETVALTVKNTEQTATNQRAQTQLSGAHANIVGGDTSRAYKEGLVLAVPLSGDEIDQNSAFWAFPSSEPHGISFSGGQMALCGADKVTLFDLNHRTRKDLTYPWFGHLHTVQFSEDGKRLLLTSPGYDLALEINIEGPEIIWQWQAWANGYNKSPMGHFIVTSKEEQERLRSLGHQTLLVNEPALWNRFGLPTRQRAVHLNSAQYWQDGKILMTLFHQGKGIVVDRPKGEAREVLFNLSSPHGFMPAPGGKFLITNTRKGSFSLLDGNFASLKEISVVGMPGTVRADSLGEWLQSVSLLKEDLYAAIDIHRSKIWLINLKDKTYRGIAIPHDWAVQHVNSIDSDWSQSEPAAFLSLPPEIVKPPKKPDAFRSELRETMGAISQNIAPNRGRSEVRGYETEETSPSKRSGLAAGQILELKQDVIVVVEQTKLDALPPELFREILEIAGLNHGKLHLVIPDELREKSSPRVAELRKVASAYFEFPRFSNSGKMPTVGFSDMEHDTLAAFQERLGPRLAARIKDSAFGLNQAGSFGIGILYALKNIPADQLELNRNGFRYDATGRWAAEVLEALQSYTLISTSA